MSLAAYVVLPLHRLVRHRRRRTEKHDPASEEANARFPTFTALATLANLEANGRWPNRGFERSSMEIRPGGEDGSTFKPAALVSDDLTTASARFRQTRGKAFIASCSRWWRIRPDRRGVQSFLKKGKRHDPEKREAAFRKDPNKKLKHDDHSS